MSENTGKTLKEEALNLLEAANGDWLEFMRAVAKAHCIRHGQVTTDDLHAVADLLDQHPKNPKAYGAIFRGPEWVHSGYIPTTRPEAHARPIRVWHYSTTQAASRPQPAQKPAPQTIGLAEPVRAPRAFLGGQGLQQHDPNQGGFDFGTYSGKTPLK